MDHNQRTRFRNSACCLVSIAAALAVLLYASAAHADQYNDKYFLQPGEILDLSWEAEGKTGPSNQEQNQETKEQQKQEEQPQETSIVEKQTPPPHIVQYPPVETEVDVVAALLTNGAILIVDSDAEFDFEDIGAWSGSYSVIIDGDKIRSAGFSDVNIGDVLKFWKGKGKASGTNGKKIGERGRLTTGQYYALIASELAMDDENIDEAALSASRFEITYRSKGKLLALIPWTLPVRVIVTGAAQTPEDRVQVKLPWYRFFVRKYFSSKLLSAEIDAVVLKELSALRGDVENVQAILFTAVADFLKQKVRTISDSVLLH